MAQPPPYDASNNPGYQPPPPVYPPQGGAYHPPQGGAYPPPQAGAYPPPQAGAYPPSQGGAYPPTQQSYAAPPPEPYQYPNKKVDDQHQVEYQGAGDDNGTMGIVNFDNKSIRLSKLICFYYYY